MVAVGTPVTLTERFIPWDRVYRSPSPGRDPIHSQYWLTPVPAVQVNVTVDDWRIDPGDGDVIWAGVLAPGAPVTVGIGVAVGVRVGVAVGVLVGEAVPAGVEVTAPGPYW